MMTTILIYHLVSLIEMVHWDCERLVIKNAKERGGVLKDYLKKTRYETLPTKRAGFTKTHFM